MDGRPPEIAVSGRALGELIAAVCGRGASLRLRAGGNSMAPLIRDGDVITVDPAADRRPGLGDIVVCSLPGTESFLVHRIVGSDPRRIRLKGDNCRREDGVFGRGAIRGVVSRVERRGRPVWHGTGPERRVIALMSRTGALWVMSRTGALWVMRRLWRRFAAEAERPGTDGGAGGNDVGDAADRGPGAMHGEGRRPDLARGEELGNG